MCRQAGEKVHIIIRTGIFLAIGVLLYLMACRFLETPSGVDWASGAGMDDVREHKNKYDVVFVGTSTSIANVSCQELYQSLGIAAVCVGEPEQPVFLSKYTLKDMFRTQSPKVVVLDAKAFFYKDTHDVAVEEGEEDFIYHRSIDAIDSVSIKKQALDTIRRLYPERYEDVDLWEYYSVMYRAHANWEILDYRNFHGYDLSDCMNGNIILTDIEEGRINSYSASDPDAAAGISDEIKGQVVEIEELCSAHGAQLVLTTGYSNFTKARHKAVAKLAEDIGVPYLDINEVTEEIGFDFTMDLHATSHFNLNGTLKWTMYLGSWLKDNFLLEDRREDPAYSWYETQRRVYEKQKNAFEGKNSLLRSLTFDDYLETLAGLSSSEFQIFITTYTDHPVSLTKSQRAYFKELGFSPDAITAYGNYAAARVNADLTEDYESEPDVPAGVAGSVKNLTYAITSVCDDDIQSGILLNEKENSQQGPGVNIVVYSVSEKETVSSVYFDLEHEENPCPRRREGYSVRIMKETAPNIWEAEEEAA